MFTTGGGGGGATAAPQSADKFYQNFFAPGAQAAQQMLMGNGQNPYSPVMWPTLAPTNNRVQSGLEKTANIANQGAAQSFGSMALGRLGNIVDGQGLGQGTQQSMAALRDIITGNASVGGAPQYQQIAANPLSNQQRDASTFYRQAQGGQYDVGTNVYDRIVRDPTTTQQDQAGRLYDSFRTGGGNVDTGRMQDVYGSAQGPSYSEQNLNTMASMTPGENPYLADLTSLINDEIRTTAKREASAAGRGYGSGYEAERTADAISRNMLDRYLNQYNLDADRKITANQTMDTQRQNVLGMQRALAGDIAGVDAGNQDRRMGAAQSLEALGQQIQANRMAAANNRSTVQQANRDFAMQGAGANAALGQQATDNRLAGLQGLTQVQGANIANRANTAQADLAARDAGIGNVLQSLALGPDMAASRYGDAAQLLSAGDYTQSRDDAIRAEQVGNMEQKRQSDLQALQAYMALLNGNAPGNELSYLANAQQISAQKPNQLAQTLGMVGTGLGVASQTGLLDGIGGVLGSWFG